MALYQPTNISPSSLNGTGVIDATKDLTVSWQINGYGGMIGWQIQIMQNDADSTLVYDSTMLHSEYYTTSPTPRVYYNTLYGKDRNGKDVPFTYTIKASELAGKVVNGYENGYKLRINQQYQTADLEYITVVQNSPVVFFARASWEWSTYWNEICTLREPGFSANSLNNPQPVLWHRWRLAGENTDDIIYDSGRVYTDNLPNYRARNLVNGGVYHLRLDGQDVGGATADTGWFRFTVQFATQSNEHIHCKAYYVAGMPCTYVTLEADSDEYRDGLFYYYGWDVYRVKTGSSVMEHAATIPNGQCSFYDFGLKNNTEYRYEVYNHYIGNNGYYHYTSNTVQMNNYWNWSIVETEPRNDLLNTSYERYYTAVNDQSNTMYHVLRVFQFQGNIKSGNVSNDNSPFVSNNFTGYPIVQKSSRKGLSGTLKALTGIVRNAHYADSISEIDDMMGMSSRETVKFLRDRKGNFRKIEIDAPIVKANSDSNKEQATEIQIPWVETGDASECQVVSTLDDGLFMQETGLSVGTTEYLVGAHLSRGVYRWSATGKSSGRVTLIARKSGTADKTVASITDTNMGGTFELSEPASLYAKANKGTVSIEGFLLKLVADYTEEEVEPTPGEYTTPSDRPGVKIAVLRPGMNYTWSCANTVFTSGATVHLRLVSLIPNAETQMPQNDIATLTGGAQTGTFTTTWGAESVTLWMTTSDSNPVTITGWTLTGTSRGEEPEIHSCDFDYLLKAGMEAGDWTYTFTDVTYAGTLEGALVDPDDGMVYHKFEIGNTASGSFTLDRPMDLHIYNRSSGQEFTIGSYTLERAEDPDVPVDPEELVIYDQDLTVQGNVVCTDAPVSGESYIGYSATSITGPDTDGQIMLCVVYADGEKTGLYANIWSGTPYTVVLNKSITRITLGMDLNTLLPTYTLKNFTGTEEITQTVIYRNASQTHNHAEVLAESIPGGTFAVSAADVSGTAAVLFATADPSNRKMVTLTAAKKDAQTVTIPATDTVEQIYVCCQYEEQCVLTKLNIERVVDAKEGTNS